MQYIWGVSYAEFIMTLKSYCVLDILVTPIITIMQDCIEHM